MSADRGLTARDKMEKAFFGFLEEKAYTKIAVSEIIEKAGVSRTTFYRHYVDIFDMYDKTCKRMIDKFLSELADIFLSVDPDVLWARVDSFCEKLTSQKKYIVLLCGKNGDRTFFEHAVAMVMEYPKLYNEDADKNKMFALKFVVLSGVATYVKSLMYSVEFPSVFLEISKKILMDTQERKASEVTNG